MNFDEVEILEYVENTLTEKRRIEFEQKMQNDAELRAMVKAMKASVLPYSAALSDQCNDNVPESIYDFFDDMNQLVDIEDDTVHKSQNVQDAKGRLSGFMIAASLGAVFFAMGMMSHKLFQPHIGQPEEVFSNYDVPSKLFESMVIYQTLYSRKTVEAVSQSSSDTEILLRDFNQKFNRTTVVPDLSSKGYEFRRVQELSYEGKPILQFVYLAETGEPVAICVTPVEGSSQNKIKKQHIVTEFAGMNTLVWEYSNSTYMLISKESQKTLDSLAEAVRLSQT